MGPQPHRVPIVRPQGVLGAQRPLRTPWGRSQYYRTQFFDRGPRSLLSIVNQRSQTCDRYLAVAILRSQIHDRYFRSRDYDRYVSIARLRSFICDRRIAIAKYRSLDFDRRVRGLFVYIGGSPRARALGEPRPLSKGLTQEEQEWGRYRLLRSLFSFFQP